MESMGVVESMGKHSILVFREPNSSELRHSFSVAETVVFHIVFSANFCLG